MTTSQPGTRRDLLLLDCPSLRGLRKLDGIFSVRDIGWDDLLVAARTSPPSTVVLVQPFRAPDEPVAEPRLSELLDIARMIPVVGVIPFRPGFTQAARTLLDQGVTELADAELERTPDAIRPRLEAVHAQPLKRLMEPALSRFVSNNARTLVRAAAEVTTDGGKADHLAGILGANERTVSGWCVREALPPPRRLLAWLRLILALSLLETPRRSVASAAVGAGYSFDYAFRRAVRDMLGGTPRQRSVSDALSGFAAELRLLRERRRQQGRESLPVQDEE